jgi:ribosomal protein S18 acetylase RimI-like enzyme
MISGQLSVQHVTKLPRELIGKLANMLAWAFHRDPLFEHALPDDQTRSQRMKSLFALNIKYGMQYGDVYSASQNGLAIWLPPGNSKITVRRALRVGMWLAPLKIGLRAVLRLGRLNTISKSLHERYAPNPHWYLFLLGVDLASQGRGLGGLLLQPVLDKADAARLPCYLETNNPSAVWFYQRHGFDVAAEHQTIASGLCLWAMRRESK